MKKYIEPENYFSKEIRKKYGLGEFNEETNEEIRRLEEQKKNNEALRKTFKGK